MPFHFIPEPLLYTDRAYCLASGFELPTFPAPGGLVVHLYLSGPFTRHHALCLWSLLATQRPPFAIWVWCDPDGPPALSNVLTWVQEYSDHFPPGAAVGAAVVVRRLDWRELAAGTALEGCPLPDSPVTRSNYLRHLAMAQHGGIYVDFDCVALRDLRRFVGEGCVYQWALRPWANSAVCSFSPADSLRLLATVRARLDAGEIDAIRPARLFQFVRLDRELDVDVLVLPVFLFDPLWVEMDAGRARAEDFFEAPAPPLTLADFWPGAYCYHWHNGWALPFARDSQADRLWRALSPDAVRARG